MYLQDLIERMILENTGENNDENGYSLLMKIFSFLAKHENERVAVFLHTSTVMIRKHNLEILKQASSSKVKIYLTENSVYELGLLKEYSANPVLRKKAANLLNAFKGSYSWSHCEMCQRKYSVASQYKYDKALFVFCEPAAASEFSKRFIFDESNFILSFDPYFSKRSDNSVFPAGNEIRRNCTPIKNSGLVVTSDWLEIKGVNGELKRRFRFSDLGDYVNYGGEAKIYQMAALPGKLIKIYSDIAPCEEMVEKIKWLAMLYGELQCCALPSDYVYSGNKCVGFVMDKIEGDMLGFVINRFLETNDAAERRRILINLSVSLLEARINQLIVADLSPRNAIVKDNGRVVFIDSDSMEFGRFPGGSVTPPYGHPGFDAAKDSYKRLRTFEETNFSYAILLFWLYMGYDDPLWQKGVPDDGFNWNIHKFPLANSTVLGAACEANGLHVNSEALRNWRQVPYAVRVGFVDVFSKQKTYDIGEWLKATGISCY